MGNIVITISWKPSTSDFIFKKKLLDLAYEYGLNTSNNENYGHYKKGYTQFIADVSGVWLAFGRDAGLPFTNWYRSKIERFGKESREYLESMDATNIDVYIEDLAA